MITTSSISSRILLYPRIPNSIEFLKSLVRIPLLQGHVTGHRAEYRRVDREPNATVYRSEMQEDRGDRLLVSACWTHIICGGVAYSCEECVDVFASAQIVSCMSVRSDKACTQWTGNTLKGESMPAEKSRSVPSGSLAACKESPANTTASE